MALQDNGTPVFYESRLVPGNVLNADGGPGLAFVTGYSYSSTPNVPFDAAGSVFTAANGTQNQACTGLAHARAHALTHVHARAHACAHSHGQAGTPFTSLSHWYARARGAAPPAGGAQVALANAGKAAGQLLAYQNVPSGRMPAVTLTYNVGCPPQPPMSQSPPPAVAKPPPAQLSPPALTAQPPPSATPSAACPAVSSVVASVPILSSLGAAISAVPAVASALGSYSGNITIFAPVNTAFAALLAALPGTPTLAALAAYPSVLGQVLQYHVAQGYLPAAALSSSTTAATLLPGAARLGFSVGASVQVVGAFSTATVLTPNVVLVPACGLTVHLVDTVLLPISAAAAVRADPPDLPDLRGRIATARLPRAVHVCA